MCPCSSIRLKSSLPNRNSNQKPQNPLSGLVVYAYITILAGIVLQIARSWNQWNLLPESKEVIGILSNLNEASFTSVEDTVTKVASLG